jgi:hypothetical protein
MVPHRGASEFAVRGGRMEPVQFIACEDDGTDQIVSFALAYDEMGVRSLVLLRTPKYEPLLDEIERGVSVSLEHETDDDVEMLAVLRIRAKSLTIETWTSKYDLDVSRVDSAELSEMTALIKRMNFDGRFSIEEV